ncbi:shikimate kinase [Clostridium botulinum]|uniref:Shikimate kinase n=3 Tax=Clostridium botulinum TaxID=1491 RepID=A0A0A0IDC3_CLOBO|nr:shikimate kinase [Clostridium botulinum]KGM98523.1 shikimate kinase [Clostridium botulinum C/D str. DC5]KOC56252.1 shikimate kinase [Clostridium botulinum]KOC57258.1 shikimate kinase [Clostridium botulinum]MCD3234955.1 shikimate kinase [Clostridium botulinum D/C]MCD3240640.1 shikimate kinase [Clostridium botulinum D/C]
MKLLERNIVLIGMPGCGKTTIGKKLSESIGVKFCDIDEYIVKYTDKSINELFQKGEDYFRKIESKVIKEVSREYPQIISTGGGVVKNYKNINELRKNGIIIFINRPLEDILSDINIKERPLLKEGSEKLYNIYKERYKLYKSYCNKEIMNKSLYNCIDDICNYIKINNKYNIIK